MNTACAASANAIGYAGELIRHGQADAVLTGGAEALSDILYSGFNALESLSPKPAAPYSRDREGLSLGEGGGMMVLMREDLARELGAPILAEMLGYSLSADGYHPTAPHPEGAGAGPRDQDRARRRGGRARRRRLRQQSRHRHGQERSGRDRRDQGRPRRARVRNRGQQSRSR